jgi:hypothetical protein
VHVLFQGHTGLISSTRYTLPRTRTGPNDSKRSFGQRSRTAFSVAALIWRLVRRESVSKQAWPCSAIATKLTSATVTLLKVETSVRWLQPRISARMVSSVRYSPCHVSPLDGGTADNARRSPAPYGSAPSSLHIRVSSPTSSSARFLSKSEARRGNILTERAIINNRFASTLHYRYILPN